MSLSQDLPDAEVNFTNAIDVGKQEQRPRWEAIRSWPELFPRHYRQVGFPGSPAARSGYTDLGEF